MKRKITAVNTRVARNALVVQVEVSELGPSWFFEVRVPWSLIDWYPAQDAALAEYERYRKERNGEVSSDTPLF